MKTGQIRSITEAFSMQPLTVSIGWHHSPDSVVSKIVEESVYINGDPYDYYVGYDDKGNRLFEFKKGTVNVMYEV